MLQQAMMAIQYYRGGIIRTFAEADRAFAKGDDPEKFLVVSASLSELAMREDAAALMWSELARDSGV